MRDLQHPDHKSLKNVNFDIKKFWCVFSSQIRFREFSYFYLHECTLTLQSESNVHGKHN